MIGRRNDKHVLTIKFQYLSRSEISHVGRDEYISPSCDRRQQDMPIVLDFVEDPSHNISVCARRRAFRGSLRFPTGGEWDETRANDDECREGQRSFLGDVME